MVLVCCPNPACSGRSVEGETVNRAAWEATWHEQGTQSDCAWGPTPGYWLNDIACSSCGTEGIDPESGQLDSAEEELGWRCPACGVVSPLLDAHVCPICLEPASKPENPA